VTTKSASYIDSLEWQMEHPPRARPRRVVRSLL
jgi:hypothetical protein